MGRDRMHKKHSETERLGEGTRESLRDKEIREKRLGVTEGQGVSERKKRNGETLRKTLKTS